jgi:hypothetical protein
MLITKVPASIGEFEYYLFGILCLLLGYFIGTMPTWPPKSECKPERGVSAADRAEAVGNPHQQ